jgi:hypothetical protein
MVHTWGTFFSLELWLLLPSCGWGGPPAALPKERSFWGGGKTEERRNSFFSAVESKVLRRGESLGWPVNSSRLEPQVFFFLFGPQVLYRGIVETNQISSIRVISEVTPLYKSHNSNEQFLAGLGFR